MRQKVKIPPPPAHFPSEMACDHCSYQLNNAQLNNVVPILFQAKYPAWMTGCPNCKRNIVKLAD